MIYKINLLEKDQKTAINILLLSSVGGVAELVEGTGLENRRAGNCTVGSNPTPTVNRTTLQKSAMRYNSHDSNLLKIVNQCSNLKIYLLEG